MLAAIVAWCLAFAGYLLFAGKFSVHEFETAAVLAAGAVLWTFLIRRCAPRRFALSRLDALVWLKVIGAAAPATLRVFGALARVAVVGGSPGREGIARFLRGAENDPRDRTRRANAVLAASLAPDSFVVRARPRHEGALLHTILPPRARDARWLT
ncbi:MAG: hypothetical protein ACTHMO_12705 [Rhodanobacteraceae bacterium]